MFIHDVVFIELLVMGGEGTLLGKGIEPERPKVALARRYPWSYDAKLFLKICCHIQCVVLKSSQQPRGLSLYIVSFAHCRYTAPASSQYRLSCSLTYCFPYIPADLLHHRHCPLRHCVRPRVGFTEEEGGWRHQYVHIFCPLLFLTMASVFFSLFFASFSQFYRVWSAFVLSMCQYTKLYVFFFYFSFGQGTQNIASAPILFDHVFIYISDINRGRHLDRTYMYIYSQHTHFLSTQL